MAKLDSKLGTEIATAALSKAGFGITWQWVDEGRTNTQRSPRHPHIVEIGLHKWADENRNRVTDFGVEYSYYWDGEEISVPELRERLGISQKDCLSCALGFPDIHAATRAARRWNFG